MPRTKDGGYILDDTPVVDEELLQKIHKLLEEGKLDEANKLVDEAFGDDDN